MQLLTWVGVCVYLFQKIDEDKLFNLFSIYGNIVRIKLLRNKPDHALIQMGDGFQAELAVHFLKVIIIIKKRISCEYIVNDLLVFRVSPNAMGLGRGPRD